MKTRMLEKKEIAQNLRDLRVSRDKSVAQVSADTGIGATALRNYEYGLRIPNYRAMFTLAEYYHKSVDAIFFRTK